MKTDLISHPGMILIRWQAYGLLLIGLLRLPASVRADDVEPLAPLHRAHAHNDYEHDRPLLDALDQGFCSVEADIFLTPQGLLVAHDRRELRAERTLQSLYLDPLRERVQRNGGHVYSRQAPFYLLIDVKTDGEPTYNVLHGELEKYADILTVTRGHRVEQKAVTVILSGNRAQETIAAQPVRHVGIDGRPEDLARNPPSDVTPWISARWGSLFTWNGQGEFPPAEKQRLDKFVRQAHVQGRQVRFWATAETPEMWNVLVESDVDFVNTDRLKELREFLLGRSR